MSVNKVFLLGYLGQDPVYRKVGGESHAQISLATSEKWTSKEGTPQVRTDWHRVIAWKGLADAMSAHLFKGSRVHVEGRLQTRSFENAAGETVWIAEVIANAVVFLGNKRRDGTMDDDPAWPPNEELPPD